MGMCSMAHGDSRRKVEERPSAGKLWWCWLRPGEQDANGDRLQHLIVTGETLDAREEEWHCSLGDLSVGERVRCRKLLRAGNLGLLCSLAREQRMWCHSTIGDRPGAGDRERDPRDLRLNSRGLLLGDLSQGDILWKVTSAASEGVKSCASPLKLVPCLSLALEQV